MSPIQSYHPDRKFNEKNMGELQIKFWQFNNFGANEKKIIDPTYNILGILFSKKKVFDGLKTIKNSKTLKNHLRPSSEKYAKNTQLRELS